MGRCMRLRNAKSDNKLEKVCVCVSRGLEGACARGYAPGGLQSPVSGRGYAFEGVSTHAGPFEGVFGVIVAPCGVCVLCVPSSGASWCAA